MSKRVFLVGIIALTMCGVTSMTAQVGINTDNPTTTLDIVQPDSTANPGHGFRLRDGNEGIGKVLTSDAVGTGTWQPSGVTMIQGTVPSSATAVQQIDMTTYSLSVNNLNVMEVPTVYVDLPKGKWMIFSTVPFTFNFSCSDLREFVVRMYYNPQGTAPTAAGLGLNEWISSPFLSNFAHRETLVFPPINNPNDGITRYTLWVGAFYISSLSTPAADGTIPNDDVYMAGKTISVSGLSTVPSAYTGGNLYAIQMNN